MDSSGSDVGDGPTSAHEAQKRIAYNHFGGDSENPMLICDGAFDLERDSKRGGGKMAPYAQRKYGG